MRILLTGAGGFLGKQIVESLLRSDVGNPSSDQSTIGDELVLHYRRLPPPEQLQALRDRYPHRAIRMVAANLVARSALPGLVADIDCVIHAAAGMRGAVADMFANTVIGTRNLLQACQQANVRRFVLISSFAVYQSSDVPNAGQLTETTAIEAQPVRRGAYGYAKTRQEILFTEFARDSGMETVILRPGVIYGPGGGALSPRVGIGAMGLFFALGNKNLLPLTFVNNCADAVASATLDGPSGSIYNVVDDDLPSCAEYLRQYRRHVRSLRVLPVPYRALLWGSQLLESYHRRSKGQLPAVFTPYVVRSMYRPLKYSNQALKSIGWTQRVATRDALSISLDYWSKQQKE